MRINPVAFAIEPFNFNHADFIIALRREFVNR
jgi:hypothetical protein